MSSPFLSEITMFPFNFAPKGWAMCNGQLLPLSQNTALFSLLGTMYGGDGKSTFALPNLEGSAALHVGQGPGLTQYFQGETTGVQNVTLITSEMPSHNHGFMATTDPGTTLSSSNMQLAKCFGGGKQASYTGNYLLVGSTNITMSPFGTQFVGSGFPHNNMQPYLTLNFCIAMQGVFPARP